MQPYLGNNTVSLMLILLNNNSAIKIVRLSLCVALIGFERFIEIIRYVDGALL